MMIPTFIGALAALALAQTGPASPEAEVDAALAAAGLSSGSARFDANLLRFFGQAEFTTPLYSALSEDPWRTPFVMDVKRRDLATLAGKPSDSLMSAGAWVGWSTRRTLIGNPLAAETDKPATLPQVLSQMQKEGIVKGKLPPLASVPPEVSRAAALILSTALRVRTYRKLAIAGISDLPGLHRLMGVAALDDGSPSASSRLLTAYRAFRPKMMAAGAHDLALAVQTASPWLATVPPDRAYGVRIETTWGAIRLSGGGSTLFPDEAGLLTIDTGGDDIYLDGAANASVANWCSVVVDTDGDDKHVSAMPLQTTPVSQFTARKAGTGPGPAGAILGYAVLFDLKGDDLYRTHRPGLGSGKFGVGILMDGGGNDVYDAYADSEGFGLFGAGILEDAGAGNDRFGGFTQVQGVGLMQGLGYLVDRGGNDAYTANDETIDFPAAQSAQHNNSMSQGAGYGRRADYLDGDSLAGGVGILFDQAGNDVYSSAVFGQGVGYWEGVGALWDSGGNDVYQGQWYVQAASAHFAIGYLEDEGGNDVYNAGMNMAQGAGHDVSLGLLIDREGDDVYKAPNLSLGAGNANGIGWFADLAGNDSYESTGWTLGKASEATANSLRQRMLNLGVFMDLGGTDRYPAAATWAKDGAHAVNWTERRSVAAESQVGVFLDR